MRSALINGKLEKKRGKSKDSLLSSENHCYRNNQNVFFRIAENIGDRKKRFLAAPMKKIFEGLVRKKHFLMVCRESTEKSVTSECAVNKHN